MTRHTRRDAVWHAALELAAEKQQESSRWRRSFETGEVAERVDTDVSDKTVRDVLATMADLEHIQEHSRRGKWKPLENDDD